MTDKCKRYDAYLQDPSTPIPKTSAWRHKKQHANEAASVSRSNVKYGTGIKRRRLYNIDASVSIPRQTKWRWKKSKFAQVTQDNNGAREDSLSQNISDTDSGDCDESDDTCSADISDIDLLDNFQTDTDNNELDNEHQCINVEFRMGTSNQQEYTCDSDAGQGESHESSYDSEGPSNGSSKDTDSEGGVSSHVTVDDDILSSSEIGSDQISISSQDKLYDGSKINVQTSWYAMMKYAMSNHLSYKAIEDLISLMQIHCPKPNKLPPNFYHLKKELEKLQSYTVQHFCADCHLKISSEMLKCSNKKCSGRVCDMVLLPLENCIRELYEKHDHFLYPFKRIQDSQYLRDMHDGQAFTDLMSPGNFLSTPQSTGLVILYRYSNHRREVFGLSI
uniref:Uncharacterized protein n=1 Tax=Amphimedon queenslandica TaxID=400682 RepID=A0A1X7TMH1_AMPQE